MTNGSVPNDKEFKEFIAGFDYLDRVAKLDDQRKDPRGDNKEQAEKERRELAHETAKKYIQGYTETNPENLDPQFVQNTIQFGQLTSQTQSARVFYDNLEDILNNQIPESTLEKLASTEEIIKAASDKDREVILLRAQYNGLEEFAKEYSRGSYAPRNEQEAKLIEKYKADGAAKAERDNLKTKGYDFDVVNAGGGLAAVASQLGYLDKNKAENYTLAGINEAIDEAKKKYENKAKSKDVKDAVRNTLKKLAEGSREEFEKAIALTYSAFKAK